MTRLLTAFCLAAAVGCAVRNDPPKQSSPDSGKSPVQARRQPLGKPVAKVEAIELWEAYEDNAASADSRYSGKTVEILETGWKMSKSADGDYVLGAVIFTSLGGVTQQQLNRMTPQERKWFNEGYPPNVLCYFPADQRDALAKLGEEATFRVRGRCAGRKADPEVCRGFVVVLKDCELVPSKK